MAKLVNFSGSMELPGGISPLGADFALVDAHSVQVDEQGGRLDDKITTLNQLNTKVQAMETAMQDLSAVPVGTTIPWYGPVPTGFLKLKGQTLNTSEYDKLAAALGKSGSTFTIPNQYIDDNNEPVDESALDSSAKYFYIIKAK